MYMKNRYFSKKFFSRLTGFPQGKLGSWGIKQEKNILTPCLQIKNSRNVINLLTGTVETCGKFAFGDRQYLPADVKCKKGIISFNADETELTFSEEDLRNIYSRRYYWKGIEKEVFL